MSKDDVMIFAHTWESYCKKPFYSKEEAEKHEAQCPKCQEIKRREEVSA